MPDPNEDDDTTTTKIAAKAKELAKKPCTYLHVIIGFALGFIAGAWFAM